MCGIGAVFNGANAKADLRASLSMVLHRGSKSFEIETGRNWAMGANRLPIVDRESAIQPARNEDGSILCVFNGEIYNHDSLRAHLEGSGHFFRTRSDTECLVHLYEEHGPGMLDLLDSEMFAFVIFDRVQGRFFAARDRIGVKPLYFARSGPSIHFASEIKQLSHSADIDRIDMVPPGHYIDDDGLTEYYSPLDIPPKDSSIEGFPLEEIVSRLRALLEDAVRKRVQTDLPVGVFFSGGLDSSIVLSLAVRYHPDVTALIIGRPKSPDASFARRFCEEAGIRYRMILPPSTNLLARKIEEIVRITETYEPNVIRNSAILYHLAKASDDFRIILCGEGADELFWGYPELSRCDPMESDAFAIRFLSDLHRTQCQRIDRIPMSFTEEVRAPFLDPALVDFALALPPRCKVNMGIEKWILRKAAETFLPKEFVWRRKAVLSEGAGFRGNSPGRGSFDSCIEERLDAGDLERIRSGFPDWEIRTMEEAYYFDLFRSFGYHKGRFAKIRPQVNRTETMDKQTLDALKSRRFSRYAPYRIDETNGICLDFFMFWGALGKERMDQKDEDAFSFLRSFLDHVSGASGRLHSLIVLLADSHSGLDSIPSGRSARYIEEINDQLERYGFKTILLSKLWGKWGVTMDAIASRAPDADKADPSLRRILEKSSARHFKGDADEGWKRYYAMRLLERPHLEEEFRSSIFLTYNAPIYREILPDIPTLHIRAKKGTSAAPWAP